MSRGKIYLLIFLVAAFFVGTGYGVYVMSIPANNSAGVIMTVNDSAFPFVNNTTTNQTTTKTTTVVKKNTTTPTRNTTNRNTTGQ